MMVAWYISIADRPELLFRPSEFRAISSRLVSEGQDSFGRRSCPTVEDVARVWLSSKDVRF